MTQLHAQPYDLSATGFYFESAEEFDAKANTNRSAYGQRVEEYEIQFIDGDAIDCDLAKAVGLNQANFGAYLEAADRWNIDGKRKVIVAVGECGYEFDASTRPIGFDVDIYELTSLRELAEQFVEDGLYDDIPERLQSYIDYDAIARDLSCEFSLIEIAGERLIYWSA